MNERIARLKTYKGIPIVFFATIDKNGVPDFKITDEEKRMRCAKERLCWICGERLTQPVCFIGGPVSIKNSTFNDGPMHAECAADSMEMCPWLCGRMDYAPPESFRQDRHHKPVTFIGGFARQNDSPDRVGIYQCFGYEILIVRLPGDNAAWFFKAFPAVSIEWHDRTPRSAPLASQADPR